MFIFRLWLFLLSDESKEEVLADKVALFFEGGGGCAGCCVTSSIGLSLANNDFIAGRCRASLLWCLRLAIYGRNGKLVWWAGVGDKTRLIVFSWLRQFGLTLPTLFDVHPLMSHFLMLHLNFQDKATSSLALALWSHIIFFTVSTVVRFYVHIIFK